MSEKQLHGHAVIELRDAKTGELTQKVEHDNIITNGTKELLDFLLRVETNSELNSRFLPVRDNLFKGVFLFDSSLNESASNTEFPAAATAQLIGHAGDTVSDGLLNTRGDFNADESGELSNGYKYVWDFGTNDANGQIACVCLTNKIAGFHGYINNEILAYSASNTGTGSKPSTYRGFNAANIYIAASTASNKRAVAISHDNEAVYIHLCFRINSIIYRRTEKIKLNNIGLSDKLAQIETIENRQITITDTVNTAGEPTTLVYDDGGNELYFVRVDGFADKIRTYVATLNKNTDYYTESVVGDATITGYTALGLSVGNGVVRNGYLYTWLRSRTDGNKHYICKVNLSDLTECEIFENTEFVASSSLEQRLYMYKKHNGDIYASGVLIDVNDNIIIRNANQNEADTYNYYYEVDDGKYTIVSANTSNVQRVQKSLWYLASINNLDTPVTKTAALTMKITYTLTYS